MTDLPPVTFELREKYLLVTGHGTREDFKSMVEASARIYEKVLETSARFLLVDYRNLKINVPISQAFNIVKRYEIIQPDLKKITMAAVFEGQGLDFGTYWKEVGTQRGFYIELFLDFDEAEQWLVQQTEK